MKKTILLLLVGNRKEDALKVQEILTEFGWLIKTRLGIHDGVMQNSSDSGLIVLEIVGTEEQNKEFASKFSAFSTVSTKLVDLKVE